jgi:hypothetical protein
MPVFDAGCATTNRKEDEVADTPKPNEIGQAASGGKLVKNSDAPHTADRDAYLKAADRLFSQFRNSQGTDPRAFMTAVVAVMMHYPLDVAEQAADPYFGLPALQQWMPTPYDVKQFCDRMARPRREAAAWDRRCREQIADSRKAKEGVRQSMEEIEDEMAKRGIFLPSYIKRSGQIPGRNYETPETVRRKLGLTQEQWDALPDNTARGETQWKPPK